MDEICEVDDASGVKKSLHKYQDQEEEQAQANTFEAWPMEIPGRLVPSGDQEQMACIWRG
ncbi:MAG: hypothetical protein Q9217_003152 [Psora testacea]